MDAAAEDRTKHLTFALEVENGWPPVTAECLPFQAVAQGYRLLVAPLFVKDLSVGDVITCKIDEASQPVRQWSHLIRSGHSTFWLLRLGEGVALTEALEMLHALGCNTVSVDRFGIFSVDVPAQVSMDLVEVVLDQLEERGVPVVCPSWRHDGPAGG